MYKVLVDTCVWLDLVKDPNHQTMLTVIEELVEADELELIVPQTVIQEIDRNKARVISETGRSLSGIIKRAKDAVTQLGDESSKASVLQQLDNIDFKIPGLSEQSISSIGRIEGILKQSTIVEATEAIKLRAAERAINKQAPFHRGKNSFNDAILIEIYRERLISEELDSVKFAFVTHNVTDFSDPLNNNKWPHPHFADFFSDERSFYFIKLWEVIQSVNPELVAEIVVDHEWLPEEPRSLSEILRALNELSDKVWYNRHHNLLYRIEAGQVKVVRQHKAGADYQSEILKEILDSAKKSAKAMEKKHKKKNLGPWDDFEWGMLNGKLSALRWVLGDEWDFLDT